MTVQAAAVSRRRVELAALVRAMRPDQWTKNLLLFAGLLFSGRFQDASYWPEALAAFGAYCAASSAAYLLNDVRDAELDRAHARKRIRPVAAGDLSSKRALLAAAVLALGALALTAAIGVDSVLLLAAFLALQLAYSTVLKHVVFADVVAISLLFVIRALAGSVAVGVRLSWWLVLCTALLAFFLALAKRRAELYADPAAAGRPVLATYRRAHLDAVVVGSAGAALVAYVAYAFSGPTAPAMALTVPLAAAGLWRYTFLIRRDPVGQEPERLLVNDAPLLITIVLWAVLAGTILAVKV
jgi:decaprenyl-phosphate phosphoribosyltransferase